MQYKSKIISCLLVICLLFSSLSIDRMPVSAAGSSKMKIRLTVDNRNVSGKTVSIRKGKKKKVRVTVSRKKNAGISFRSNKRSVAAVSKTGKITAKRIGTAKITVTVKSRKKKYKGWLKVKVVAPKRKNDASLPTKSPVPSPTVMPTDIWVTEPTGALNKSNSEEVLGLLSSLHREGQGIVMVTHDVRAALYGTRILYMEDGRILDELAIGKYEEKEGKAASYQKEREKKITDWLSALHW